MFISRNFAEAHVYFVNIIEVKINYMYCINHRSMVYPTFTEYLECQVSHTNLLHRNLLSLSG